MATGYIAINRSEFWWQFSNARTVISGNLQNGYASDTASWPVHTEESLLLKMQEDEYPSGVSLSGSMVNLGSDPGYSTNITLALCDQNGNNSHVLNTVRIEGQSWTDPDVGGHGLHTNPVSLSMYNTPNGVDMGWTDLAGKILALARPVSANGYDKLCVIQNTATITVTTGYVAKTVSLSAGSNGTAVFQGGSNTYNLSRNSEADVYITASQGYKIKGTPTASSGRLTPVNVSDTKATYRFKMSQPATDATVYVEFEKNVFNIVKNINVPNAGNITGADTGVVGDSITISRTTPSNEFEFNGWEVKTGSTAVSFTVNGNMVTFTMPPGNVTVTAKYTAHAITWSGASITATQNGSDITLTYKGVATDNFGRQMTYWIYRNGAKAERDTTEGINPLDVAPSNTEHSVVVHVDQADVSSDIRFSLVAESGPLTSGGASVSMNVGEVNRTVKYCVRNGKKTEWVECVPYFCAGPKYEQDLNNVNVLHYVRISYPGTYQIDIVPIDNKTYTFKNNFDEDISIVLQDAGSDGQSNTIELSPGESTTQLIASTRRTATFTLSGEGSVEVTCENYPDLYNLLQANEKKVSGVWVEVEPYYYYGSDGWQLCSFA